MINLAQRYKGIVFYNPAECRCLMDIKTVELIKKDLEILDVLKGLIEIIPNNATDTKSLLNIRVKPLHIIDDKILLEIKEWLDNEK